jgi:hypothetical protein
MHSCGICGAEVAKIRMRDGSEAVVNLCPLPYRTDAEAGRELITADGLRVSCRSCFPEEKDGTGYLAHRHEVAKR